MSIFTPTNGGGGIYKLITNNKEFYFGNEFFLTRFEQIG